MLQKTIFDSTILCAIVRRFSTFYFRITKWKLQTIVDPSRMRCVIVAAPHTTWRDLPYSLMLAFHFNMRVFWIGKEELFVWPFKGVLLWLGGIPVKRNERSEQTDICGKRLRESKMPLQLVIAPSGTRKNTPVEYWRRGYWEIARKGNVPLLLGYINYTERQAGIGEIIKPTMNYGEAVAIIKTFYKELVPLKT